MRQCANKHFDRQSIYCNLPLRILCGGSGSLLPSFDVSRIHKSGLKKFPCDIARAGERSVKTFHPSPTRHQRQRPSINEGRFALQTSKGSVFNHSLQLPAIPSNFEQYASLRSKHHLPLAGTICQRYLAPRQQLLSRDLVHLRRQPERLDATDSEDPHSHVVHQADYWGRKCVAGRFATLVESKS